MSWFSWQVTQPGRPSSAKASQCGLALNCSAKTAWQVPQTFATDATCGGAAPWLPWQELQVGEERSPFFMSASKWTLFEYFA